MTTARNPEYQEYYDYLDELRESGRTNMFGAGQYLIHEMYLEKAEARRVLRAWLEDFGK